MKKFLVLLVSLLMIFGLSGVVSATIIDFQSLEDIATGYTDNGSQYIEDGFQIDGSRLTNFGTLDYRYSGSTGLFSNYSNSTIQLSKVGGGTFDLFSIDPSVA